MNAVVVYESIYGNTRQVAEAVAKGLGGARVVSVGEAGQSPADTELLVVGGPTHMHGLATRRSRQVAVEGAHEDGHVAVEPNADGEPGLRQWLRDLPQNSGARAATFDTRADKSPLLTGAASRGIARRLDRRGYEVVAHESFLVEENEGPLEHGELERAEAWGEALARRSAPAATI